MQATYQLKPFPFQVFALVFTVLAAAIIGGLGGYWLKSLDHQATAPAAAAVTTVRIPSMVGENAGQPTAARPDAIDRLLAAQSATLSANSLYEQGGRPTAVYAGSALTTGTSMVGENARQDNVASTKPILDGWETRVAPRERLHDSHRR